MPARQSARSACRGLEKRQLEAEFGGCPEKSAGDHLVSRSFVRQRPLSAPNQPVLKSHQKAARAPSAHNAAASLPRVTQPPGRPQPAGALRCTPRCAAPPPLSAAPKPHLHDRDERCPAHGRRAHRRRHARAQQRHQGRRRLLHHTRAGAAVKEGTSPRASAQGRSSRSNLPARAQMRVCAPAPPSRAPSRRGGCRGIRQRARTACARMCTHTSPAAARARAAGCCAGCAPARAAGDTETAAAASAALVLRMAPLPAPRHIAARLHGEAQRSARPRPRTEN